jgi:hypothetical protein
MLQEANGAEQTNWAQVVRVTLGEISRQDFPRAISIGSGPSIEKDASAY